MNKVVRDRSLRNRISSDVGVSVFSSLYGSDYISPNYISKVNNRCYRSGRSRAVIRKFRLNRVMIRENVDNLGRTKSSW